MKLEIREFPNGKFKVRYFANDMYWWLGNEVQHPYSELALEFDTAVEARVAAGKFRDDLVMAEEYRNGRLAYEV
jgi:hypothetical protein